MPPDASDFPCGLPAIDLNIVQNNGNTSYTEADPENLETPKARSLHAAGGAGGGGGPGALPQKKNENRKASAIDLYFSRRVILESHSRVILTARLISNN